jgi:hypothetical protein
MTTRHRIRLAPTGHRCGLFFAAGGGATLSLFVLPKPWGATPLVQQNERGLLIIGYEGDRVLIDADADLSELLDQVAARVNDDIDRASPEDGDDPREAGLGALLSVSRTTSAHPAPQRTDTDSSDNTHKALLSLIRLAAMASSEDAWQTRARLDATEDEQAGAGGAVSAGGAAQEADPLLLLAQWRLVELMQAHSRQLRRGYIAVEEASPVIRGRLTQRGLIQAAARQGPLVECAHDEFSDTTPLFRVLVTALDRVASGALAEASGLSGWSVLQDVRQRAVHLRRQLHQLPSYPRAQAAAEAERLSRRPLPRSLRLWQPALHLARAILRQEATRPVQADAGVVAQHWWLNTSKLWEGILDQICKKAGWEVSAPAEDSCVLWDKLGNQKKPDLLLERREDNFGQRIVADAKYKLLNGGALSAADQYQLFAYSHIARWGDHAAKAAAVLYPCAKAQQDSSHRRQPDNSFVLHVVGVRFPTREELDPTAWAAYLSKAASALPPPLAPTHGPASPTLSEAGREASPTPPTP